MEKRFILPALASIILTIVAIILSIIPLFYGLEGDIVPIIPGGALSDSMMSIIIPFIFMILMLFVGPIIALFFFKLHELMKLKKYDYFFINIDKKLSGKRILLRSVFPGLLAINIGLYISLSSNFSSLFFIAPQESATVIEYASVILGIPISSMIILPLWILGSSGLMCSKRIESYNRPVSPDIESVGQFFTKMIKGYLGVSTVISYILVLYQLLLSGISANTILLVFIDPIVIIFLFTLISLLIEVMSESLNARFGKYLEKQKVDITPKSIKIE